jgi:hypothetical protein
MPRARGVGSAVGERVSNNVYAPDKVCELAELYKQQVLGQQTR